MRDLRELYRLFRRDILLNFYEWVYQHLIKDSRIYKKYRQMKNKKNRGGTHHE